MTIRALPITVALVLALAPAALAQDPEDAFEDGEPVPTVTATPGCERGPGTDADYAYCPDPCVEGGDDADYVYCVASSGSPRAPKPRKPAGAVQALPVQALPMTGGEPWLIAGAGAGFLLAGAGLRIRFRPR